MNIHIHIHVIYLLAIILILLGCQGQQPKSNILKTDPAITKLQTKVAKAFENAPTLHVNNSKWFDRVEKLPLTIITTAYIDNEATKTKEYKIYKQLIKKIEKDITILDKLSGKKISDRYSSVEFIDYSKSEYAKEKFNSSYTNRYEEKSTLTDVLRPDVEKPSQELLIRLNYKELKKGNLTIEGYKTVKQKDRPRNSYYYTLRKENYNKLSNTEQKQAIANSILATLELSIPEYTSVDRKELVKGGEVHRFITPNEQETYTGTVYLHESGGEAGKLESKLQNLAEKQKLFNSEDEIFNLSPGTKSAVSVDGKYIFESPLSVWASTWTTIQKDIKTRKEIRRFDGLIISFSPDGHYLVLNSGGAIKLYDLNIGKFIAVFSGDTSKIVWSGFTGDSKLYIQKTDDGIVKVWNIETTKILNAYKRLEDSSDNYIFHLTEDNKYILSVMEDEVHNLVLFDVKTGKNVKAFDKYSKGKIEILDVTSDNKYVVTCDDKNTLTLWCMEAGKEIRTFNGHNGLITVLMITANNKYVFTADNLNTLKLWSMETGEEIRTFNGHEGMISKIIITKDDSYLFSISRDQTIKFWDIESAELLKTYNEGSTDNYATLENPMLTNDGKYLIYTYGTVEQGLLTGSQVAQLIKSPIPFTKNDKHNLEIVLPNKIKELKSYASYREDISKQNILTTPITKKDIETLKYYDYLHVDTKTLNLHVVNKIVLTLNYSFLDPVISMSFQDSYAKEIGTKVTQIKQAYQFTSNKNYSLGELFFTTAYNYEEGGYKVLYEKDNILDAKSEFEVVDKEY
ncbi:hypothetical protein N9A28_06870 [Sulfurimonas sp.]|nr:hypothetical protein [Sulfurimonas sp.]